MFTEKDILARLQNGEDVQNIANEMAAIINKANKMYADEKAAEEAKKAQAEQAALQEKEELQEIIDLFCDWTCNHLGVTREEFGEIKADQVIELIDSLKGYIDAIKDLESLFSVKNATKPTPKITKSNTKPKSADEQISDFLKQMGW